MTSHPLPPLARRRFLWGGLAGVGLLARGARAQPPAEARPASREVRLALLMGNRNYPQPFDLPPIPKNLRDIEAVLERRGFQVT